MAGKSYKIDQGSATLRDVLDEAFSEISSLGSELRDWADNMQDGGLGATDKYTTIDEAASTLEGNEDAPDIPRTPEGEQDLGALDVTYVISVPKNKRRGPSRQVQLDNVCAKMTACVEVLDEYLDEHKGNDRAESLRDDIQQKIDELEGIEIPGMYG